MELTHIHPNAKIGKDVKIDQFSYIAENVEIGEGTSIGPHVTILDYVKIGRNCKISAGAILGGEPQDYKFGGETTYVEIGDNTIIREFATVHRGTKEGRGKTVVGNNCMIMAYAHVAHDCIIGDNAIIVSYVALGGFVEIGEYANIGGHTAVHQFSKIGAYSMIGGCTLVVKDIPPYALVGNRPTTFHNLNLVGLRRNGFSREQIERISEMYRIIYRSGLNMSDACRRIEEEFEESLEKRTILDFIKSSKRGVLKRISSSHSDE